METVLSLLAGVGGAALIALVAYFSHRSTPRREDPRQVDKALKTARHVVKTKASEDISDIKEILEGKNPERDLSELLNKE